MGESGYGRGCLLIVYGIRGYYLNYGTRESCEFRDVTGLDFDELHAERMRLVREGGGRGEERVIWS